MNFSQASLIEGAFEPEHDGEGPFAWTRQEFVLQPNRAARFARLRLCYLGACGTLRLSWAGGALDEVELSFGWQDYVLDLGDSAGAAVNAHVSPIVPVAGDTRELAVMLREVDLFDDQRLFENLSRVANSVRGSDAFGIAQMNFSQASLIAGAFEPEHDGEGPFAWTRQEFVLQPNRAVRLRA